MCQWNLIENFKNDVIYKNIWKSYFHFGFDSLVSPIFVLNETISEILKENHIVLITLSTYTVLPCVANALFLFSHFFCCLFFMNIFVSYAWDDRKTIRNFHSRNIIEEPTILNLNDQVKWRAICIMCTFVDFPTHC